MHQHGQGVEQDIKMAVDFYQKGCELGMANKRTSENTWSVVHDFWKLPSLSVTCNGRLLQNLIVHLFRKALDNQQCGILFDDTANAPVIHITFLFCALLKVTLMPTSAWPNATLTAKEWNSRRRRHLKATWKPASQVCWIFGISFSGT